MEGGQSWFSLLFCRRSDCFERPQLGIVWIRSESLVGQRYCLREAPGAQGGCDLGGPVGWGLSVGAETSTQQSDQSKFFRQVHRVNIIPDTRRTEGDNARSGSTPGHWRPERIHVTRSLPCSTILANL